MVWQPGSGIRGCPWQLQLTRDHRRVCGTGAAPPRRVQPCLGSSSARARHPTHPAMCAWPALPSEGSLPPVPLNLAADHSNDARPHISAPARWWSSYARTSLSSSTLVALIIFLALPARAPACRAHLLTLRGCGAAGGRQAIQQRYKLVEPRLSSTIGVCHVPVA